MGAACRNCDGRKCMACVCREVHDACQRDCPFCCPEYAEQERARWVAWRANKIDRLIQKHRWSGGYSCACGAEMNSPETWARHVLEDAL